MRLLHIHVTCFLLECGDSFFELSLSFLEEQLAFLEELGESFQRIFEGGF
jgi:hypothetical protein